MLRSATVTTRNALQYSCMPRKVNWNAVRSPQFSDVESPRYPRVCQTTKTCRINKMPNNFRRILTNSAGSILRKAAIQISGERA